MIDNFLEERAALFVAGAMTPEDREEFELVLEFDPEVRTLVYDLQWVASAIAMAHPPADLPPLSQELKSKILQTRTAEAGTFVLEGLRRYRTGSPRPLGQPRVY